jgi:hypothetical protein
MADETIRFDDGASYELMMGRWSLLVGEWTEADAMQLPVADAVSDAAVMALVLQHASTDVRRHVGGPSRIVEGQRAPQIAGWRWPGHRERAGERGQRHQAVIRMRVCCGSG